MLTNLKIERLKPESKTKRYSDRDGLTLEVRPSGNKRFIFRFQWQNKPQTITLGRYPSLSLVEARNIASSYRSMIDKGVDPRVTQDKEIRTKTLKHMAKSWLHKNIPNWRASTIKLHKRGVYIDILPIIGDKSIDEITRADLLRVIHPHEEAGHHEIAHRLHDRLKAIFDYAIAAGLTENYPFNGLKKGVNA